MATYIHERNPAAAVRFGAAIREAGEVCSSFRWPAAKADRAEREWVMPRYPYILVYTVDEPGSNEIMILGVFHGAQDRASDELAG